MERYKRQSGFISNELREKTKISVIGAGGIGSKLVADLAKMGFKKIQVWDDDVLEEHNISNQCYPHSAVGTQKVQALKDHIEYMEGFTIDIKDKRFDQFEGLGDVVISGVDSMKSRQDIWELLKKSYEPTHYIDMRMGGWAIERLIVELGNKEEEAHYESTLVNDDDPSLADIPCTEKAVIFNTSACSSMAITALVKILTQKQYQRHTTSCLRNEVYINE